MLRSAICCVMVLCGTLVAAPLEFVPVQDTAGQVHRIAERQTTKATAIVFLNPDCPLCQRFIPTLNALASAQPGSVEFYGVVSHQSVTRADAAKFATDYEVKFPVLFDALSDLAQQLEPTHVPEAFVLNSNAELKYRGRINDWYDQPGKPKAEVKSHDFKDALAAVLSNKPVSVAKTKPVGCFYEDELPKRGAAPAKPNYNRHISAILDTRCVQCHRTGEVAPFPLGNFLEASRKAKQIATSVANRQMPPWKAEKHYGHFLDENHLTPAELATIAKWVDAGASEGELSDKPLSPKFPDGWQLGKPDLIVRMPTAYALPADGKDVIRNFVVPLHLKQDEMVRAMESNRGIARSFIMPFASSTATALVARSTWKTMNLAMPRPRAASASCRPAAWVVGLRASFRASCPKAWGDTRQNHRT